MIIQKKYIRSLKGNMGSTRFGSIVVVGLSIDTSDHRSLIAAGFSASLEVGESVLPSILGRVSKFNAEGTFKKRTDLPMETAYRQIEWSWIEWHGQRRVKRTEIRDLPYERYQREFIPPPSLQISITADELGKLKVVSAPVRFTNDNEVTLLHTINLFLELFGRAEILDENHVGAIQSPTRVLNWTVLPPGQMPWAKLKGELAPILRDLKKGNSPVVQNRLEVINSLGPEFTAIGRAGFRGYVVFGFPMRGLYVLESLFYGNATYVFENDWERLSMLTKAQILVDTLQKDRIIHREGWDARVRRLIGSA